VLKSLPEGASPHVGPDMSDMTGSLS